MSSREVLGGEGPAARAQGQRPTVVIDNYDSFTWNIVEYLLVLNPQLDVHVYRNDKITIQELKQLDPARIVVSPGPGHPLTDSGISQEVIQAFSGKVPIFGVCMGQQCIFSVFGGSIESAGEILHGKTSLVKHDGRGLYKNVPQDIAVTRYHSLAGTKASLPTCLEVTSWTQSDVIMGVRHRKYTLEGVQYHPESILSESGKQIIQNFLNLSYGTWEEEEKFGPMKDPQKESILEKIYARRLHDVSDTQVIPGFRRNDLQLMLDLNACPPQIDFVARLKQTLDEHPALMAEIKRASPSKKDIDVEANAASQALEYAESGASVISCLTEPHWFKGSLFDLRAARDAVASISNRPAILRKEFILSTYQILEARVNGADSVLLIVAMLQESLLQELYNYSISLGMEPLVEVNSAKEMEVAIKLGAKVIGVNNRNLHTFDVDLGTTSSVASMVPKGTILCALSGISARSDVVKYMSEGVSAVLVGEALMRAPNTRPFVADLLDIKSLKETNAVPKLPPIVKICGTRTIAAAETAMRAGADLIGMILVPGSTRCVSLNQARAISNAVRQFRASQQLEKEKLSAPCPGSDWFDWQCHKIRRRGPSIVGVFRNQPMEEVQELAYQIGLDFIQLHGKEPIEMARMLDLPVIKAFSLGNRDFGRAGYHAMPLLDAVSKTGACGGLGLSLDWKAVRSQLENAKVATIVAGGLTPDNVVEALKISGAAAVDTSSGIETDGEQDLEKITSFVRKAKAAFK